MTSVKVSNINIFASLQDDSDNEAPVAKKVVASTKAVETKPAQNNNADNTNNGSRGTGRQGERRTGGGDAQDGVRQKKEYKPRDPRDGAKDKGVSSAPHPQDRKSGTGQPAYEKKYRRDGAGRGNYGTVKNEVEDLNKLPETAAKVEVVEAVVEPEEPVIVDNTITVDEYFRRLGVTNEPQVVVAPKRELNQDELKRDKLQVVVSKTEKAIDQNVIKAQKKKNSSNTTYLLGCNTDHSELLGVKTGQVAVKFTEKPEGEKGAPRDDNKGAPREPREPREHREPREQRPFNPKPAHHNNANKHQLKKAHVENDAEFPKLG